MTHCSNRLGTLLVATAIALITGVHGVKAQEQSAMFADADGLEPPDAGAAYAIPNEVAMAIDWRALEPELTALLSDPDGIEPLNSGFAYAIPDVTIVAEGSVEGRR